MNYQQWENQSVHLQKDRYPWENTVGQLVELTISPHCLLVAIRSFLRGAKNPAMCTDRASANE